MPRKFDAVVIGAGPAGSMAAYEIAAAGHAVLLLEKHKRPGTPLCCAEAVSKYSFELMMEPLPEWISAYISKIRLVAPSGHETTINHPGAGYILDRKEFDNYLARRAVAAGGRLECETIGFELKQRNGRFYALEILKSGDTIEEIEAGIFIAADGVESKIARLAGMENLIEGNDIEALLQYRLEDVDIDCETVEFFVGNDIAPRGYVWVFPKSDNTANVGIGISTSLAKGDQSAEFLEKFISGRFRDYRVTGRFCGLVPRYQGADKFALKNLLVVGDAARALDSLSGAGIVNAMMSGKHAGLAAADYLSGKVDNIEQIEDLYPGHFLEEKGNELKMYLKLRRVYNHLNDDDFNDIIESIGEKYGAESVQEINAIRVLTGIIMSRPRLLRLARYLL